MGPTRYGRISNNGLRLLLPLLLLPLLLPFSPSVTSGRGIIAAVQGHRSGAGPCRFGAVVEDKGDPKNLPSQNSYGMKCTTDDRFSTCRKEDKLNEE